MRSKMRMSGFIFAVCIFWFYVSPPVADAAEQKPVFHLTFDDGLSPAVPAGLAATNEFMPKTAFPAEFRDGVRGKALFLGAKDHLLTIPAVERYLSPDGWTLVFWIRKPDGFGGQYNLFTGAFGHASQTWWHGFMRYDAIWIPMLTGTGNWQMIAIAGDALGRKVFYNGVKVAEVPVCGWQVQMTGIWPSEMTGRISCFSFFRSLIP